MSTKWRQFASNTTVHGLRYVYESPSRVIRSVWLILLLISIACYLFFAQQSIARYFSRPINVEYTEVVPESGNLIFPAITICNLNRFVKRKIYTPDDEKDFHKLGLNLPSCAAVKKVITNMTCGQALLCAYERYGGEVVENCNKTKHRIVDVLNSTKEPIFDPEKFLGAYGHEFEEMFTYYCTFATKEECKSSDFFPNLIQGGRCFTFNSGENGTIVRNTSIEGSSGGLAVVLDVQMDEVTISEFSRGLRVIIHEQGEYLSMDTHGFNVFPGSHALVRMTSVHGHRLKSPYKSNCTERVLPGIPHYSSEACITQCFANKTVEICGCRLAGVPLALKAPVCTFQHQYCLDKTRESFNPYHCFCGLPCQAVGYRFQVSNSEFPDQGAAKILHERYGFNKSMEYQRRNLVFLQIGFQYQGYTVVKERASYGIESLLGDLGGNMGLFLGCSILTLFEFGDLLWKILKFKENQVQKIDSLGRAKSGTE
ncbi:acid-sensing ion channel 2-like isoform X1 [Stylophora pistillata]|uniref:acid-sensing ion channel 2-like isoform X1 n=1 Tax=Stylophora pistillata TaxID=50429 RepID=UPI000C05796D|nr:acid-sensing ion channel 2-like isoform X1 [Stylophora pistillata]